MIDIISHDEIHYIQCRISSRVREAIGKFPMVIVTGARQGGFFLTQNNPDKGEALESIEMARLGLGDTL